MNPPSIIQKLILALFVALAAAIGLVPVILYLGRPDLLVYFAAEGAIIALIYFLTGDRRKVTECRRPTPMAYVLVGLGSVAFWGTLGLLWLTLYGMTYWVIRFARWVAGWIGWQFDDIAAPVAFYVTLAAALIFAIGFAMLCAQKMFQALYSKRAGAESPFYEQVIFNKKKQWSYLALSIICLAAMGVGLWLTRNYKPGWWWYYGFQLLPYISGAWLLTLETRLRKTISVSSAIDRLLELAGCQVIFRLPSGDEAIDYLLSDIDMLVKKGSHVFAVKVKTEGPSSEPVGWSVPAGLSMKMSVLQHPEFGARIGIPELSERKVIPLVMLAGRQPAQSFIDFTREESVPYITIAPETLNKILESDNQVEMERVASEISRDLERAGESAASVQASALIE